MATFPFANDPQSQIEALYVGYFGRAADQGGLTYWLDELNSGAINTSQIAASFSVQVEAEAEYPFLANPLVATTADIQAFITQVYQNLFNRMPDTGGLAYWQNYLSENLGNPKVVGDFILAVIDGAQSTDQTTIANKISVANFVVATEGINFTVAAAELTNTDIAGVTADPTTMSVAESAIISALDPPPNTPASPVINAPASPTTNVEPAITGSAPAGSTVTLHLNGSSTALGTAPVGGNGQWTFTPSSPLPLGVDTLSATDTEHGVTSTASAAVTIDVLPPPPLINAPASPTTNVEPTITGSAPAGSTVTLHLNGGSTALGTAPVGSNGLWTFTPSSPLPLGVDTLSATDTDNGVTSAASSVASVNIISDPPATYTLTLGADNINAAANNVQFNAPLVAQVATLQTGDSIVDTGTGGTLNASFNPVTTNLLGAAIHGVSTWNLTNVGTWDAPQWITGGSLVSGLLTLNDVNSNAPLVVGVTGASLQSALTTVGLTDTDSSLTVLIAASALSGTNDSLALNLDNAGIVGPYAQLTVEPDGNATNGYENWHINITGNNLVDLYEGSATSAKTMTLSGSGNITLYTEGFANLTTIDASSTTGNVLILGGYSDAGNAGLLTVVKGGSGNDTFDLSAAAYTPVVIDAMTTLNGGGGTNTLIVNDATLTTTIPLTTPENFQIFEGSASGTINMALLPSSVTELELGGSSTIINALATFTLALEGGGPYSIDALNVTATTNELIVVNPDTYGSLAATGYGIINIISSGSTENYLGYNEYSRFDTAAINTFTANPDGSEIVNISGTEALTTGLLSLSGTSTTINDTDTGLVTIYGAAAGVINAASSGGLVMVGPDTNVNGTTGDIITGSTVHANTLVGSLGNDVITASEVGGDTINTAGGADTIYLNGHTVSDTIQFNGYQLVLSEFGDFYSTSQTIVNSNDQIQPGFWGVPPSGVGGGIVPAASTSVDQSVITNFTPGSSSNADILQFSVGAWGVGYESGFASVGLTPGNGINYSINDGISVVDAVTPGATLSATADVIEITGATFANAAALATALGSTFNLTFAGTGVNANTDAHMLFLYNDASGNAHIADVDFENGANAAAATTTSAVTKIVASDMVELVGVSEASLTANNIHFVY